MSTGKPHEPVQLSDTSDREHFKLDLHFLSVDAAETAVRWWLEEEVPAKVQLGGGFKPKLFTIVTGQGKSRSAHQVINGRAKLRDHIAKVLNTLGAVCIPYHQNPGNFVVDARAWFVSH